MAFRQTCVGQKSFQALSFPKGTSKFSKKKIKSKYKSSKSEVEELIKTFQEKGYKHGASYLEKLSDRLFTNIGIWLKTGIIAPKTTSLLERVFRKIGVVLKKLPGVGRIRLSQSIQNDHDKTILPG